jgi:Glyoxalase-like domain
VTRLRQAVVAAADRDEVVAAWTGELGLGAPFHDPGVETFGLHNSVLPVGDTFLEVVSPLVPGDRCPAERFMLRMGGDCGYMAIFQVEDIDAARAHLDRCGLRRVLDIDLDDIRASHVHPADVGAAIVSFDQPTPSAAWRWAGPGWAGQVRTEVVTGLAGIRLAAEDPAALVERWGTALAIEPRDGRLALPDGTHVEVAGVAAGERTGLVGIDLWAAPGVAARTFEAAGVAFRLVPRET